jgi:hypothetical protein
MNVLKNPVNIRDIINETTLTRIKKYRETFNNYSDCLNLVSRKNEIHYYLNMSNQKLYGYNFYTEEWIN